MTDEHYAAARAEAIEEGATTPRDRAAHALMRNTEDGLPHWTDDLDDSARSHWRSEADRMLGGLLESKEIAEVIYETPYSLCPIRHGHAHQHCQADAIIARLTQKEE